MSPINQLLLIIAVMFVAVHSLEHRNFRKEWKIYGHKNIKFGKAIATNDNSFLYAVCKDENLPAEMNCNVVIETPIHPWEKNVSHKDICGVKLVGSDDGNLKHEVTAIVSVERFTDNRAIILWWERQQNSQYEIQNIKVSILHMKNCTVKHLTFPVDLGIHVLLSNVVIYPDKFDVVISHKATCGTPTCRISHDANGERIGEPRPFITNFAAIYTEPVNESSPDKGFYVSGSDMSAWKFRAMYVGSNGDRTNLMTASVSDPRQIYRATSNAYELYGICLMGEKKIHCAQFDAKANVKMNASLSIPGTVEWMAVHNLLEGGILLIMGNCNSHKCRSFKVSRVNPDGRRVKAIDVPKLHLKCSNVPYDFSVRVKESENELCFYFACMYEHNPEEKLFKSIVKFSGKCIPKSELKVN